MITIYHVPHSRSLRVVWLMEELGEDYRLEKVSFPTPAAYREVSPLGTVPATQACEAWPWISHMPPLLVPFRDRT